MARAARPREPRPAGHEQAAAAGPDTCRPVRPGANPRPGHGGRRGMTPPGARSRRPGHATLTETVQHWL